MCSVSELDTHQISCNPSMRYMTRKTGTGKGNGEDRENEIKTSEQLKEFLTDMNLWPKLRRGESHLHWCNFLKRLRNLHPERVKVNNGCFIYLSKVKEFRILKIF